MESTESRLLAEARHEPVKNAFRLGWEFVERNQKLALATIGIFVLLSVLELVPLLGLIASIALGVFSQAVQIYIGRRFYEAKTIGEYVEGAGTTTLKEFFTRFQAPAFGAWLGWFVISMVLMVLFFVLLISSGFDPQTLETSKPDDAKLLDLIEVLGISLVPILLLAMVLSYVYPIAQGRVILSDTFGDAFKAVFSMFTPAVWRHAMRGEYFSFVVRFGLVLIGAGFVIGLVMMLLLLIPVVGGIVDMVAMMVLLYVLIMVLGVANVMAREIAEG